MFSPLLSFSNNFKIIILVFIGISKRLCSDIQIIKSSSKLKVFGFLPPPSNLYLWLPLFGLLKKIICLIHFCNELRGIFISLAILDLFLEIYF